MSWQLIDDLVWNIRLVVALDVYFYGIWIVFFFVHILVSSKPTRLYKSNPAIIAKDCTYEGLHFSLDDLIRFRVFFNAIQQSIMLIDLCSQLA